MNKKDFKFLNKNIGFLNINQSLNDYQKEMIKFIFDSNKENINELHNVLLNDNNYYLHELIISNNKFAHIKTVLQLVDCNYLLNNFSKYKKLGYYWKCIPAKLKDIMRYLINDCNSFIIINSTKKENNFICKTDLQTIIDKLENNHKSYILINEDNFTIKKGK